MTNKSKQVEIEITAKVRAFVTVYDDETLEDLQSRDVDIYLHGAGPDGYMNKQDLGTSEHNIKVINAENIPKVVPKNSIWTVGKELPPVGTVCEYRWGDDKINNWYKIKVVLHDNGYAVFSSDVSTKKHNSCSDPERFRPLYTAREWAIQEMSRVFHDASNGAIDDTAFGALYDAGFIKR